MCWVILESYGVALRGQHGAQLHPHPYPGNRAGPIIIPKDKACSPTTARQLASGPWGWGYAQICPPSRGLCRALGVIGSGANRHAEATPAAVLRFRRALMNNLIRSYTWQPALDFIQSGRPYPRLPLRRPQPTTPHPRHPCSNRCNVLRGYALLQK